ncbi:MAG TPA: TylF/MycF family methyltransferase [Gaiellaceae bacterium]|nr:TylF/MycF family methyltransferase [Gaiellaceae bacterium]
MGPAELYLDLLKKCLTRYGFETSYVPIHPRSPHGRMLARQLDARGIKLVLPESYRPDMREEGRDWPLHAETMIGLRRLDNLQECVTNVIRNDVPGDLIETGVWRGGATIFMRGILKAYGDSRLVWVADSFQGLPPPDESAYPADGGSSCAPAPGDLAVPLDQVQDNFRRYGLLDDQVRFLPGWFRDTLPDAPIERLAVMRLDGDLYESTILAMESLYPRLSVGGYVIVDDYVLPACSAAIDDYRARNHITEPIEQIDWSGVFWRREQSP